MDLEIGHYFDAARYRTAMPSWKQKAMLQRFFSTVPGGYHLNFFFQRHVTHGLPISDEKLRSEVAIGVHHVRRLAELSSRNIADARFFEFGAGSDLHLPIVLWSLGVEDQTVFDVRPLARPDLVADVARRLAGSVTSPEFVRLPLNSAAAPMKPQLEGMGIKYRAPGDARATGLPNGSIDFITSTNTLEHIPPADIQNILAECHRILCDDGLMSFQIDYMDHYSYFDPSISAYNFLTFDERSWRRYNPSLHFQNRLRHSDHLALLADAGFTVIEDRPALGDDADLKLLQSLPLAQPFSHLDPDDVATRASRMVLAKSPTPVADSRERPHNGRSPVV